MPDAHDRVKALPGEPAVIRWAVSPCRKPLARGPCLGDVGGRTQHANDLGAVGWETWRGSRSCPSRSRRQARGCRAVAPTSRLVRTKPADGIRFGMRILAAAEPTYPILLL